MHILQINQHKTYKVKVFVGAAVLDVVMAVVRVVVVVIEDTAPVVAAVVLKDDKCDAAVVTALETQKDINKDSFFVI